MIEAVETTPSYYSGIKSGIERHDIAPNALKVMSRLTEFGYHARLVGGGVRDLLLGKSPKDFDVATDARPDEIKRIFRNCRIIGRRFKLAHIFFANNETIEVATYRDNALHKDGESSDDELQDITLKHDNFYGSERTDALRRDITINGLFYDAESDEIIDYVGGMDDIQNRVIRVIGEPAIRFAEDPVRIIRVVRHAARSGFAIEKDTYSLLKQSLDFLQKCPKVRLFAEFLKDISSGSSAEILSMLESSGIFTSLVPTFPKNTLSSKDSGVLYQALKQVDRMIVLGSEPPVLLVLTLISIYCQFESPTEVESFSRFVDWDEEEVFGFQPFGDSLLEIPKRYREQLFIALKIWYYLNRNEPLPKRSSLIFGRKTGKIYDLVKEVHKLLPCGANDKEVYERLSECIRISGVERKLSKLDKRT